MALPYYTKLAKIEGDLTGATIDWDWEWSEDSEPPNVVPLGQRCIVTTDAIEDKPAVLPNQGTLTLIPSVTCNANTVELSPISLTISLNFVEPPAPCCLAAEGPPELS